MKNEEYSKYNDTAINLVTKKFLDKIDLAGKPYLDHLYAVAGKFPHDAKLFIIALLHDILEDTDTTRDDLSGLFPSDIVITVEILTRKLNEPYFQYIERIGHNKDATLVKKADLIHNMSVWRLPELEDKDLERLKKYFQAYKYLESKWV